MVTPILQTFAASQHIARPDLADKITFFLAKWSDMAATNNHCRQIKSADLWSGLKRVSVGGSRGLRVESSSFNSTANWVKP